MIRRRKFPLPSAYLAAVFSFTLLIALVTFSSLGCQSKSHTSDSRLKKIDKMLNSQLPKSTPRARVEYFLNSRGYRLEAPPDKHSVVAVVRHIDTETLQPASARVTFHFDVNDKLVSYDMEAVPDAAPRP
ncbi:MAG: hypothetical protein WBG02_00395 [Candidatus Acidiferrum sp.]